MKKIIVCDSGLGGLNIASRLFNTAAAGAEDCSLIYFNAYPDPEVGFNKLNSPEAQEKVFQNVLQSMEKFSPDLCLIACNTLSIIYERLTQYYQPAFPVKGIIDAAVNGMYDAMHDKDDNRSQILILGTKTTVESGAYAAKLCARGIAQKRICALAVPGLATLLESDPDAPEVADMIRACAVKAADIVDHSSPVLHLALCCTHFEFAGELWTREFSKVFPGTVKIVNPNSLLGGNMRAVEVKYTSRIKFFPGAKDAMCKYFDSAAPAIADSIANAAADENLFEFNKNDYL